jgi:hypothetical protein
MSAAERPDSKIPTRNPQPMSGGPGRGRAPTGPGRVGTRRRRDPASGAASSVGSAVPGSRAAIVTDQGITVYPARCEGDRWRAVWYEPDGSRRQCQSVSQQGLAARLEKVTERLAADAPNMLRSGSELIGYYLSDDRRPAERAWSRRHADTQRYLCTRYLEPVIGHLASQDIRVADMQAVVNAAPTAKEGKRVRAMISALVGAGISGGYLASDRLKGVHWQAQGRAVPAPRAAVAGESVLFVDPAEMPAAGDVARLGQAVGANQRVYELMVNFAAYTGLRWGEPLPRVPANPRVRDGDLRGIHAVWADPAPRFVRTPGRRGRAAPGDRVPPGSFLPPPPDDPLPGGQVKGTLRVSLRDRCATPDMPVRSQDRQLSGVREENGAGAAGSGRATAWVHRDCKTVSSGDDPSCSLKLPQQ